MAKMLFALTLAVATLGAASFPDPQKDMRPTTAKSDTVVLAGGCFWGVEAVFERLKGVTEATSGYAGGSKWNAQYEIVGTGTTGHAESVRIAFDPRRISYGHILQIYFSVAHDPTELDRQGPDVGTQYRSAIFPTNPQQTRIAEAYITQLNQTHVFNAPVATKIESGRDFYPAEEYHQDFLARNPNYLYIMVYDLPKIKNLQRLFPDLYRATPVLVAAAAPRS